MPRVYADLLLFLRSQARKFWWNLGTHMTLLASAGALTGLFLYIFRDFVGYQLATLDPAWSKAGLFALVVILSLICGIIGGQWIVASKMGADSMIPFMSRVGISLSETHLYKKLLALCGIIGAATAAALLALALDPPYISLAVFTAALVAFFRGLKGSKTSISDAPHIEEIVDWRRHQLLHRTMPGRGLILLGIISSVLIPLATLIDTHIFLLQIAALGCGLTATFGLIHAVAAELPGSWFEKQAGLTHAQWITSWQHIANAVAFVLALSCCVALLLQPPEIRREDWSLPFIAASLPWLVPSLVLQIEGRAKNINMMVAVLIALFLGTAMIATPWAAAVVPLLRTQAKSYQNGRFYRA